MDFQGWRKPKSRRATAIPLIGLLLTGLGVLFAYERRETTSQSRFRHLATELRSTIELRIQHQMDTLTHIGSMMRSFSHVSAPQFQSYIEGLHLEARYPEIETIGFMKAQSPSSLDKMKLLSAQVTSHPKTNPTPSSIIFKTAQNSDFRQTMAVARDSGRPEFIALTLPASLALRPSASASSRQSPLLVMPVYRQRTPLITPEERRAAFMGFVYITFQTPVLLAHAINTQWLAEHRLSFEVFAGQQSTSTTPLLQSLTPSEADSSAKKMDLEFKIGSTPFTLRVLSKADFISTIDKIIPLSVMALVLLLSIWIYRILARNATQAEELSQSEQQMRLITDSLPVLISYIDSQSRYRFNNRAFHNWFGTTPQEAIYQPVWDIIGSENYDSLRPHIDRVFRGETVSFESQLLLPDGSRKQIQATYSPDLDTHQNVRGFIALMTDISDRVKNEDHNRFLAEMGSVLSASLDVNTTLARFASLLAPTLADWCAIDLLESDGDIRRVALSSSEPHINEWLRAHVSASSLISQESLGASVIHSGEPLVLSRAGLQDVWASDMALPRPEHKELNARSAAILPLKARGRVIGALTIVNATKENAFLPDTVDFAMELSRRASLAIDNAQLYSEAKRANHAKDEFLATLSHELRTPMNVILGWLEILSTEDLDRETFQQIVATLTRNAELQIHLINDLLDISRIISGKLVLRTSKMDLGSVIRNSITGVRAAALAKRLSLRYEIPSHDLFLHIDADRIQQVLWNLLSNAIKFTPEGGSVLVRLVPLSLSVQIIVEDTGQGIDPRFLPFVFDRFRQEDGSSTRAQGGLGLGLSIVRYLVELHGGSVSVHSKGRAQGATFMVTLPRQLRAEPQQTQLH